MVRHNNTIPNGHFHKQWQKYVKLWFDQPFEKAKRNRRRTEKANKVSPRPVDLLRPIVHCPSVRYHSKRRLGNGFTLRELKGAGLNKKYARTVGIAVDHRRRNKSYESMNRNVVRLQDYVSRLIVYPVGKKGKIVQEKTAIGDLNDFKENIAVPKGRVPTDEEKKFEAFVTLRKARTERKSLSRKLKRMNKESKGELVKN